MENFLQTYCSLCNKTDPIIITYGMTLNDNMFNTRLSKTTIQNIINIIYVWVSYKL